MVAPGDVASERNTRLSWIQNHYSGGRKVDTYIFSLGIGLCLRRRLEPSTAKTGQFYESE